MTDNPFAFKPASLADFSGQVGRRSRPRLFIRFFFVLIALGFMIGIGVLLWQKSHTATEPRTAVLTEASGQVEWRAGSDGTWQVADPGTELHIGDQVRTAAGANALITYFEGSITRMGVETSLELTDLSARQDNRWTSITFTQLSGHTDQLVLPLPSADSRFEVTTAAALIQVHGTAYQITVADNGDTQVEVTQGQVIITAGSDEHTLATGESLLIPFTLVEGTDDSSPTPIATHTPVTMTPTATTVETQDFASLPQSSPTGTFTTTTTPVTATITITPTSTSAVTSTPTRPINTTVTLPALTATPVATLGATATTNLPTLQPTRYEDEDENEDEDEDENEGGDD